MRCDFVIFSEHALVKMAERGISPEMVEQVIEKGEVIKTYPDDKPSPSQLLLGFFNTRPIHVLIARDIATDFCIVITTYFPDTNLWATNFKTKRL